MKLSLSHCYPGLGVVLYCIDSCFCTFSYFADKSEKKEKKMNLKCDLLVSKVVPSSAATVLTQFLLQKKEFQLDLTFRPQGCRPDDRTSY